MECNIHAEFVLGWKVNNVRPFCVVHEPAMDVAMQRGKIPRRQFETACNGFHVDVKVAFRRYAPSSMAILGLTGIIPHFTDPIDFPVVFRRSTE